MLNKLVKNSIQRTYNSRKKKIDVRMYCADWEWYNSEEDAVSLQTEKKSSHYMVFEVIDFGDPKLSKRCIKDIFKPPTSSDMMEQSANLSNLKHILLKMKGKIKIIPGVFDTNFSIAFPISPIGTEIEKLDHQYPLPMNVLS